MRTSFGLELHNEWSEFADECIGLCQQLTAAKEMADAKMIAQGQLLSGFLDGRWYPSLFDDRVSRHVSAQEHIERTVLRCRQPIGFFVLLRRIRL
jgi:hypothetical protein